MKQFYITYTGFVLNRIEVVCVDSDEYELNLSDEVPTNEHMLLATEEHFETFEDAEYEAELLAERLNVTFIKSMPKEYNEQYYIVYANRKSTKIMIVTIPNSTIHLSNYHFVVPYGFEDYKDVYNEAISLKRTNGLKLKLNC